MIRRRPCIERCVDDHTIVLSRTDDTPILLDPSATRVWRAIDEWVDIDSITGHAVDADGVREILAHLDAHGLLDHR